MTFFFSTCIITAFVGFHRDAPTPPHKKRVMIIKYNLRNIKKNTTPQALGPRIGALLCVFLALLSQG